MKVLTPGHTYELENMDGDGNSRLQFVSRLPHRPTQGVLNQEVLRALIDRVKFLDSEIPWEGNQKILYHLRMALVLHEARALIRDVEKGSLAPESVPTGTDGHFKIG